MIRALFCQGSLFVLHVMNTVFLVLRKDADGPASDEEFQYQLRGASWLKIDVHRCDPFERPPKEPSQYIMGISACDGLLMVFAELMPFHVQARFWNKLGWLYNLSTRKWSVLGLPELPIGKKAYSEGLVDQLNWYVDLNGLYEAPGVF